MLNPPDVPSDGFSELRGGVDGVSAAAVDGSGREGVGDEEVGGACLWW